MKEDIIKPPRTVKSVIHNEETLQPPGTFKKERKKKKKKRVRFTKKPPPPPSNPPPMTVRSLVQNAMRQRLEPSVPSQRFDPSSPFQIKGRPIVKKTPAPPPPRRRQSNLKTPVTQKTPAPPPPRRRPSNLKTPAPPPPRRPGVSETVENVVVVREEKKAEASVTEQKLRTRNEELRAELEKRRRELEQSNRKLLEHTQESSKLLQGLRDRLEEARLDMKCEAEKETNELRVRIESMSESHEREIRTREDELKALREELETCKCELETCKCELTRSQEASSLKLKSVAEELESCKSKLERTREMSRLELKSVREELTCSRAESKRLYSEIESLQKCAHEEKQQLRHKSRVLLVSHLAASRARRRRRLCSQKQSTTTTTETHPKWWYKIQETAREDSLKYLQERKNEIMKCSEVKRDDTQEEQRSISALRSAVRTVLQRRTQCRDAVLSLSEEDQNQAKLLRKRTSRLDSRLKAVMKRLRRGGDSSSSPMGLRGMR